MKKIHTLAVCLTLTVLLNAQTVIYVKPEGTGDGQSWATACSLEEAMSVVERSRNDLAANPNASAPLSDRVEIWVQSGTYYPSKMLIIPDSVKVYGGFTGTEENLPERDFAANPTIVDAQEKFGSVFRLGISSELNGFTVQNGSAQDNPHKNGGGIWADNNTTIRNCVIINNSASAHGGGLYACRTTNIINSTIENNTAAGKGENTYGNCLNYVLPVSILVQPSSIIQTREQNVAFAPLSISATGNEPLTYQWYSNTENSNNNGTSIPDATDSTYVPSSATIGKSYYYCEVSNPYEHVVSNVSGQHVVWAPILASGCNANTPGFSGGSLGTVSFASSTERVISGYGITQIWSDAVTATGCNKNTYAGGSIENYSADCRSNPNYPGDLFSWCAVVRFRAQLCPAPWRVPIGQDFIELDIAMGGTGGNRTNVPGELIRYVGTGTNQWGGAYSGYCDVSGGLKNQTTYSRYWALAVTDERETLGRRLHLTSPQGNIYPVDANSTSTKDLGFALRCIR